MKLIPDKLYIIQPQLKDLDTNEVYEKIEILNSLGYIFDPLFEEFYNPIIRRSFKPVSLINLTTNQIVELDEVLHQEYRSRYGNYKTYNEVCSQIASGSNSKTYSNMFFSLTGILSLITFVLSIVLLLLNIDTASFIFSLLSFLFLTYYIFENFITEQYQHEHLMSKLWISYKPIFIIIYLLNLIYVYYQLYIILDSYWIPLIIIGIARVLIKKLAKKRFRTTYWIHHGFKHIYEFYRKKGLL